VVPDTSALVRGVWFEDLDWPAELKLSPTVRIVVPILVVEELDRLKDRERITKAGDRARRVLRRLRTLCAAVSPGHPAKLPQRTGVTIEVLVDDDWHQRRPNDAEIIDQALLVKALTGQDVRLVCVDAAMEFRARQHGLTVFAMPTHDDARAVLTEATPPAPGGLTAALADRFVAQLTPTAVEVLAVLCRNAPQLTYEALQAQVGIGRQRLGGVLTSLAAARRRLPRGVVYPIERDPEARRYRIEPIAAELLLAAVDRARVARDRQ